MFARTREPAVLVLTGRHNGEGEKKEDREDEEGSVPFILLPDRARTRGGPLPMRTETALQARRRCMELKRGDG